jgi:O-antigen biosynthesis protein
MFEKDPHLSFKFSDPHSPHRLVTRFVKPGSSVLDVGCNTGYIGQYLIENRNCVCDGIDYDAEMLKTAKRSGYSNVFEIDLYKSDFRVEAEYDALLFIDILEHLPNPYDILLKLSRENLKKGGIAIICLPNVARFEYRLKHLFGKFEYEESGIMHQDHLRFFTNDSAARMIEKIPLKITKVVPTGLGHKWGILPNLTAFQFIYVCLKDTE